VIERLARAGPVRITPVMARFLGVGRRRAAEAARILDALSGTTDAAEAALAAACDAHSAACPPRLVRDSISPTVVRAGIKYNVIPGEAVVEVDCRILPGTTPATCEASWSSGSGPSSPPSATSSSSSSGRGRSPGRGPALRPARRDDPRPRSGGDPAPVMAPFGTDAKHTIAMGTPTYGFSPLRPPRTIRSSSCWHGVDERVSVDALRWGCPSSTTSSRASAADPTLVSCADRRRVAPCSTTTCSSHTCTT
jgi:acetylornithine deacetylase/succinyl-diaminopimelate desuccinylase-like protein